MIVTPYLITLSKVTGKSGNLSFLDQDINLPIEVKRSYWIYDVEDKAVRGNHAHINSDRVIVCLKGAVNVILESVTGERYAFRLDDPSHALYFPRLHWIRLELEKDTVLLVFTSCVFREDILIDDYEKFRQIAPAEYRP